MKRSLLCASLVCASAMLLGQANAAVNTNYRISAPSSYQYKNQQWLPLSALRQDQNGDQYLTMKVYKDGNIQQYRGYLAKNGRKGLVIIMRDQHTLEPLAVEAVAKVTTVEQLQRQGLKLSASRKYGRAQPGEQVLELSWLKQPYFLRQPSQG